jgi:hypothetical protein
MRARVVLGIGVLACLAVAALQHVHEGASLPSVPAARLASFRVDHLAPLRRAPSRLSRHRHRVIATAATAIVPAAAPVDDEASSAPALEAPALDALPPTRTVAPIETRVRGLDLNPPKVTLVPGTRRVPPLLQGMYSAFGTLYAADVALTLRAIGSGNAHEVNPLLKGVAAHTSALVGVKAASAVATIYLVEKLRKRHPRAALMTMAAIDAGYVAVVVHNAQVAARAGRSR